MQIPKWGLDKEEVQEMIKGNYSFKKCKCCDLNGIQYWDGATGLGVNSSPMGIDPQWLTSGSCEECNGYGHYLVFDD